jgi:hypothetical protein
LLNYYFIKFCTIKNRNNEKKNFKISTVNEGSYPFVVPAGAKLPNPKPNARWRDGFSLVPSIPVGCADNAGWALWPELCMMSGRSFAQARNQIAKMPENRHFQQKNNCA